MRIETAMKRRQFLKGTMGAASVLALAGCDNLTQSSWFPSILSRTENLTERVQRAVTPTHALAREYGNEDISTVFPANGNTDPGTADYAEHVAKNFSEWTVGMSGLVQAPRSWSLAALKELPSRTQITRHDCVEGWSAIGKWSGVRFSDFLQRIGADLTARYVGFKCADDYSTSIDMQTALHPQTQLTLHFGDELLPAQYGFPMKLRIPTKLGFKNPKHITALYVTNEYPGGYWEDQGYNWYSGS